METELGPLLPATMSGCAGGCGPSALAALTSRDIKAFREALLEEDCDVEEQHQLEGVGTSLLEVALDTAVGRDQYVSALVEAGARADRQDPASERVPFHTPVRAGDVQLLKVVLRGVTDINVQDGEGSSALHVATESLLEAGEQQRDQLVECLGLLLLVPGVELNTEDMKGEATPLFYAATAGCEAAVDLLLSFGGDAQNDNTGEKVVEVIRRTLPGYDMAKINQVGRGRPLKNILFNMIEVADNVVAFRMYTAARSEVDWDSNNGQYTLLQYAAEMGREGLVGLLLQKGASPAACGSNCRPAWVIAAYHGYHKVLRVFFDLLPEAEVLRHLLLTDTAHGQRTVLHEVVRRQSPRLGHDNNIDYDASLRLLFEDKRRGGGRLSLCRHTERIINFRDRHGETALHYATQQPSQRMIKLLLEHGANMGVKNNSGRAPGTRILPDTLSEFFDDCVTSEGIITDDEFRLTFNYNFLAPPLLDAEVLEEFEVKKARADAEEGSRTAGRPETEALWYMSESRQHRALLKHPLIASFLWMKWQRIRSFYYLTLATYAIFVLLLTGLVLLEYGGCGLSAPLQGEQEAEQESGPPGVCWRGDTVVLRLLLGILTVCLVVVELVQLAVSFKRYMASPENLMQVVILAITAALVMRPDPEVNWQERRHLAALVLLMSWTELMLITGLHPSLNTKLTMFYTVFVTFFQFLLWYVFFIIAFALSFYVMFHTDHTGGTVNDDYPFFDKISTSLLKCAAMFVGELEFSDIPFAANSNPLRPIIFVAFIFLIVVVLMNLLNGLAVSDIGLIREEAEVLSLKAQVDLISYVESILLNDPYNFLTSWPRFLAALPSCSACFWVKKLPGCEGLVTKMTGGTKILLFYDCLPEKTAAFLPNKLTQSCNPYRKRVRVAPGGSGSQSVPGLEVRRDILESAKAVVMARERGGEEGRLDRLEELVARLASCLQARS